MPFLQVVQRHKDEVSILPCSQSKEPECISIVTLHWSAFSIARRTLVYLLSLLSHVLLLSALLKVARACAGHLYLHLWPCVRLGTHRLAVPSVCFFQLVFFLTPMLSWHPETLYSMEADSVGCPEVLPPFNTML